MHSRLDVETHEDDVRQHEEPLRESDEGVPVLDQKSKEIKNFTTFTGSFVFTFLSLAPIFGSKMSVVFDRV